MASTGFGPKVIGEQAFQAERVQARGGSDFGPRVKGPPKTQAAIAAATRAPDDGISLEELTRTLTDNPTFCESLYMQELARVEGPRKPALQAIHQAAVSLRKYDITREIDELLATPSAPAAKPEEPKTAEELSALPYDVLIQYGVDKGVDVRRGLSREIIVGRIIDKLAPNQAAIGRD